MTDSVTRGRHNVDTILNRVFSSHWKEFSFSIKELAQIAYSHEPIWEERIPDFVDLFNKFGVEKEQIVPAMIEV